MNRLTITLVVVASDSEEFGAKAAAALAHVAALPEFKEGTYEPGKTWVAPNGVAVRADYLVEEGVGA